MYGLSEVTFRSFMLKRGWSRVGSELTAADTVAAVTALLEAGGRQDDPDNTHTAKFWCARAVASGTLYVGLYAVVRPPVLRMGEHTQHDLVSVTSARAALGGRAFRLSPCAAPGAAQLCTD